jgi:hypothetical protein
VGGFVAHKQVALFLPLLAYLQFQISMFTLLHRVVHIHTTPGTT